MTSDKTDVVIGDSFNVNVNVSYSDVTKGVNSGYGVSEIVYEIKFDDNENKQLDTEISNLIPEMTSKIKKCEENIKELLLETTLSIIIAKIII